MSSWQWKKIINKLKLYCSRQSTFREWKWNDFGFSQGYSKPLHQQFHTIEIREGIKSNKNSQVIWSTGWDYCSQERVYFCFCQAVRKLLMWDHHNPRWKSKIFQCGSQFQGGREGGKGSERKRWREKNREREEERLLVIHPDSYQKSCSSSQNVSQIFRNYRCP